MIKLLSLSDIQLFDPPFPYTKITKERQHRTECILKKFGQCKVLPVWENETGQYFLIAGSSVFIALKSLDEPFAYCHVYTDISPSDVLLLNMIDNQHRELDVIRSAKTIELMSVTNHKALSNVLHHSADEIKNFKDLKDFNWSDFDNNLDHFKLTLFD